MDQSKIRMEKYKVQANHIELLFSLLTKEKYMKFLGGPFGGKTHDLYDFSFGEKIIKELQDLLNE